MQLNKNWQTAPLLLIGIVLLMGLFFRLTHLDQKMYGLDESYTSLRISGYSEAELVQNLREASAVTIADLQKYQRFSSEKTVMGTILGLATEEPQHPPLYYGLARLWAQAFGDSVTVTRLLPALFSLLVFPCLYWLCLELFLSPATAWVAMALTAISPFHLAYAQEARQYSLWTAVTLLSCAALLRALRTRTIASWGIYAVSLTLSFYTFLLSGLVAVGHGIYVVLHSILIDRSQSRRTLLSYMAASGAAGLMFIPWIMVVMQNWSRVEHTTNWNTTQRIPVAELVRAWIRHPGRIFFDINLSDSSPFIARLLPFFFTGFCFLLVLYAIYFVIHKTPQPAWLFILTLVGSVMVTLALQDLFMGGQSGGSSAIARYLIPCYLGFGLCVAHLLAYQLTTGSIQPRPQPFWQGAMAVLLTGGIVSCVVNSQAVTWWNKGGEDYMRYNLAAAAVVNQSEHPLLVTDSSSWALMLTSHLLKPTVHMLVQPDCFSCSLKPAGPFQPNLAKASAGFSDVFLYPSASPDLQQWAEKQGYRVKSIIPEQSAPSLTLLKLEK